MLGDKGYTQQKLASELGASQSQVSRILNGKLQRRTRLFDRICIIAYGSLKLTKGRKIGAAAQQSELIAALDAVWDGTAAHASALAVVIRSLAALNATPRRSSGLRDTRQKGGGEK